MVLGVDTPMFGNQRQECDMLQHHKVVGGGGVQLHAVETGNSKGRPLMFIHGFSQCGMAWSRQLNSDLADTFRLVAIDLRGHGLSGKPTEGYEDSRLWADDVHAVIRALDLDHPVLCGWSYGPLVILDYIRHYGEGDIRGANFIGGVTKLGSEDAASVLTPEFLGLIPGFFSTDAQESVLALTSLIRMCIASDLSDQEFYLMLGFNVSVPPYVRKGLFSRAFDNDDLLPKIRKPVLITHGDADAVVSLAVIDKQMKRIANTQTHVMANAGHACFWDEPAAFNQRLRKFVEAA
jgi:pimeloyl-ACP methyl ester carboxylesterase